MKKQHRSTSLFVAVGIALCVSLVIVGVAFMKYGKSIASDDATMPVVIEDPLQQDDLQKEMIDLPQDTPDDPVAETTTDNDMPVIPEEPEPILPPTIHEIAAARKAIVASQDASKIVHDVPFTTQAPGAQWDNPVFQDGCEEASVIMGMMWVTGEKKIGTEEAGKRITELAAFAKKKYGESLDLSTEDTTFLVRDYYNYENVYYYEDIDADDIIDALYRDSTVIIAVNGKKLYNPNFKAGGPENHMLIISGYDPKKKEFITNDPGTRKGEEYRYTKDVIDDALRNYPTGFHEPNPKGGKMMIELWK